MIIKTIKLNRKLYVSSIMLIMAIVVFSFSIYAFSEDSFPFIWKEEKKDYIKWVNFTPTYSALNDTSKLDIESHNNPDSMVQYNWIELLSYLACKYGGDFKKYNNKDLLELTQKLESGISMEELTKDSKYYSYYFEAYDAVLHEFIGEYEVTTGGDDSSSDSNDISTTTKYGIKVFSPIAKNYSFSHYDDFGNSRSYGYKRVHLGNDLMGSIRHSSNCS